MSERPYRRCTRCIMDTSDPDIAFDDAGVCSHCASYDALQRELAIPPERRPAALQARVERIAREGRGRPYDCVVGISGGVDSTYVALLVKRLGLRPLAVHMDSGWNSELAVSNIENIVDRLGIDLFTHVVEWEEMRDLQLSFFRASVPNCDIPQDHAIVAVLHHAAHRFGVRTIVRGVNLATESILPRAWGYTSMDLHHIKAIHRRFGSVPLRTFPTCSVPRLAFYHLAERITYFDILNYVEYDKHAAKRAIVEELGWRDYGGKHHESLFTKFFQSYYLVKKFGFDKRLAHLSNMVLGGTMTREAALAECQTTAYDPARIHLEMEYVASKLDITVGELEAIIAAPPRRHGEFPAQPFFFDSSFVTRVRRMFK